MKNSSKQRSRDAEAKANPGCIILASHAKK